MEDKNNLYCHSGINMTKGEYNKGCFFIYLFFFLLTGFDNFCLPHESRFYSPQNTCPHHPTEAVYLGNYSLAFCSEQTSFVAW